jgi:hypothetical protein
MTKSIYESDKFERLRAILIDQYHSQIMAHAGYILALIIGSLTLISRFDIFIDRGLIGVLTLLLMLSAVVGLGVYFSGRLFYWNCLTCLSLSITENEFKEYHNIHLDRGACLGNLQLLIAKEKTDLTRKNPITIQNRIACTPVKELVKNSIFVSVVIFLWLMAFWLFNSWK